MDDKATKKNRQQQQKQQNAKAAVIVNEMHAPRAETQPARRVFASKLLINRQDMVKKIPAMKASGQSPKANRIKRVPIPKINHIMEALFSNSKYSSTIKVGCTITVALCFLPGQLVPIYPLKLTDRQ